MGTNENTTTVPSRKPRRFRWALWWGLGIIVSSLAALVVYAITNPSAVEEMNAPLMKAVYSMICRFGIWPVIVYMGLVGPVLEELSFRGKPVRDNQELLIAVQNYHFQNFDEFLGVPLEEVRQNMKPRVIATSVNNIIEEYFSTHNGLDAHMEGRIVILD